MQYVTVREFRANTAAVWRMLKRERHLVITRRGKPVAVFVETDQARLEDTLEDVRRRQAIEAVAAIRREAKKNGTAEMSMAEIDAEIAAARRDRRR
jgi:antitoxin (DNA-binding transcriptional repressor) of toxin-antitoxin stability system